MNDRQEQIKKQQRVRDKQEDEEHANKQQHDGLKLVKDHIDSPYFAELAKAVLSTGAVPITDLPFFHFEALRFFESGHEDPPESQFNYATRFATRTTRFVVAEIRVKPEQWGVCKPVSHNVHVICLYPPNRSIVDSEKDIVFPRPREGYKLDFPLGQSTAGHWNVGEHQVLVFFGMNPVLRGSFTISDDDSSSLRLRTSYFGSWLDNAS